MIGIQSHPGHSGNGLLQKCCDKGGGKGWSLTIYLLFKATFHAYKWNKEGAVLDNTKKCYKGSYEKESFESIKTREAD